jgi:ABC-2 type transport system permease protein
MKGQLSTSIRFALIEKVRNRFALLLLLVFVPIWDVVLGLMVPRGPAEFKLQSTGTLIQIESHNLTLLTAGLNALTLIVGFMIFSATQEGWAFDKRLMRAGLRHSPAMLAKVIAIVVVSAMIALYATVILLIAWPSVPFFPIWLSYSLDALIYGAFGLLLGVLVNSQLSGFFLIIMISLLDTFIQAPIYNPLANKSFLAFFPSYGPMQIGVSGGFGNTYTVVSVALSLGWAFAICIFALIIFWLRTRTRRRQT